MEFRVWKYALERSNLFKESFEEKNDGFSAEIVFFIKIVQMEEEHFWERRVDESSGVAG